MRTHKTNGTALTVILDDMEVEIANVHDEYADLFAAAPDLLKACKSVFERMDEMDETGQISVEGLFDLLRAAIAKAEGR